MINTIRRIKKLTELAPRRARKHFKLFSQVPSNNEMANDWSFSLQTLRKNGYCKLPGTILPEGVLAPLKGRKSSYRHTPKEIKVYTSTFKSTQQEDAERWTFNRHGKLSYDIDDAVWANCDVTFLMRLHKLLQSYYNQDYWVRNPPKLIVDCAAHRKDDHPQSFYHLDWGFHQVSLIVLLNSTSASSTRTRLIKTTNNFAHLLYEMPFIGGGDRNSMVTKTLSRFLERRLGTVDLIGEAGSCFLIDAGNSFHKAVYGSDRAIVHFNFAIDDSYLSKRYQDKLPKIYQQTKNILEFITKTRKEPD